MPLLQKIKKLSSEYFKEIVSIRQHLHAHPELSFCEFETSEFVISKLSEYGIQFKSGVAGTGIVALIKGRQKSSGLLSGKSLAGVKEKTIALRADMDALPIAEKNDISYKSKNNEVMHACGHDAHTASLLGVAKILNELKNDFTGNVKLIFQPGEEKFPGGASLMIKEGVLENPKPASIFGQHVSPEIPAGKIGLRAGMYMASADELYVTVRGKSGHAAFPKQTINPLLIASKILLALNEEFMAPDWGKNKERASPLSFGEEPGLSAEALAKEGVRPPTVLSFGKIVANGATNIIPEELKLEGTFRTMNEKWREEAHGKMKKIAEEIAYEMGGKCEFNILKGYPFLINDEKTTQRTRKYAAEYIGKENIIEVEQRMGAEDFAWYSQKIPACFYRLGVGNEAKKITSGLHTPNFNIDESALEIGMGFMAWVAINELKE